MRHACGLLSSNLIQEIHNSRVREVESRNSRIQLGSDTSVRIMKHLDGALLDPGIFFKEEVYE